MFDLFFLSYDEPAAERHWANLQDRFPRAQRVHGVQGILAGHRRCADLARTSMFWVVDADNEVLPHFDFSHRILRHERNHAHVWYARNPVNGLEYGWGGIKLFPTTRVRETNLMPLDMTTSFPLKVIPTVSSITHFDTDAFAAWRAAFREAAKLTLSSDPNAPERLKVWTTVANGQHASSCLSGALAGQALSQQLDDPAAVASIINDYEWLRRKFEEAHA